MVWVTILKFNYVLFYLGATLTLRGDSIPTNSNILITNINPTTHENPTNTEALLCLSELPQNNVMIGDWYLHPTQQSTEEEDRIRSGVIEQGWFRNRAVSGDGRIVRLHKKYFDAGEGVFTCHFAGDKNTPTSVGIYYPSESV